MSRIRITHSLAALLIILIAQPIVAAEWLLLSRHGECAPLDALAHKLPSAPSLNTPDDLEAFLKSRDMEYSRKVHSVESAEFHEFQVPAEGLSVILVPRQRCTEVLPGPR